MGWRISRRKGGRKGRRKGWKNIKTGVKLVSCEIKGLRRGMREGREGVHTLLLERRVRMQ